jgi:hypothetical protein
MPKGSAAATVEVVCPVCGKIRIAPRAWVKRVTRPCCSKQCAGKLQDPKRLAAIAHKGRAGWSEETAARFRERMQGSKHPRWKGGRRLREDGYWEVLLPDHLRARSTGYVLEHIVLVERRIGRSMLPGEEVHHKDRNRANNADENLQLCESNAEHVAIHRVLRAQRAGS